MKTEHRVLGVLLGALEILNNEADSNEDQHAKSLTIDKLEEALMWADKILNR